MRVRRVLAFIVFLLFAEDSGTIYGQFWIAPLGWLHDLFYEVPPYKIRFFDHVLAVCLFLALRTADGKGPRVPPMRKTLLLAATTVAAGFVVGVIRGGDFRAASWQTYLMVSTLLYAFCIAAAFRTPQHFMMLAKAMVAAGIYRAVMCWLFYFLFISNMRMVPPPEYITTHDDTVLWVVSLLILVLRMLETKKMGERLLSFAMFLFIVGAVQFNARRLAWVSLVMGLIVFFVLLRKGSKPRRRMGRFFMVIVPVLALYTAVGWGSSAAIFKPLRTFSSVTTTEDASTKARNIENLGLCATADTNWLLGAGWGHKYIEISNKYSIASAFELWPYVPHNSILGLLAYSGALGFYGFWLAFPTAVFLNARVARLSTSPQAANIAVIMGANLIVCANQMYGDMGIFSPKTMYMLGTSYAVALRLPILVGAWTDTPVKRPARQRVAAQPAPVAAQSIGGDRSWPS